MLTEAWTIGSIDYGAGQIRSGFAILALVALAAMPVLDLFTRPVAEWFAVSFPGPTAAQASARDCR